MSKTVKIGSIWLNDREVEGKQVKIPSIRLGNRMKKDHPKYKAEYDISAELVIKDGSGKVITTIKDGFVSMYAPKEGAPAGLKYELVVPREPKSK